MRYKIVKDKFYGYNVKYKKRWFHRWRSIKDEKLPFIIWNFNSKEEAKQLIETIESFNLGIKRTALLFSK